VSQLDRRQALRLFAALGAAGAAAPVLSACSSGGNASDETTTARGGPPVKIGMIVPQTGANKALGDDMANGFQLYLRNSSNTLGGRQVTLVTAEEGETAETGRAAAEKLIKQDQVLALTGVVSGQTMKAIKDLVEGSQLPLVGSNAAPTNVGGLYIWRTSFLPSEPSQAMGRWVAEHADGFVAVVAADYPGDKDEVKAFLDVFNAAGGKMAGSPRYTPLSTKDYSSVLQAVKESGASAMFCYYAGGAAVDFVKQIKAAGFPSGFKVFAPGALTEGTTLKQEGDAAKGIYTAMNYSPDLDNAANRRFVADYQKQFTVVPSTFAMASFDAAAVLDKAITEAGGSLTSQSLNAALGRLGQIESPRGAWQFSANRAPLQRWYMRQVRNDGMVLSNVLTAELTTLG
jgi:branched-chain amino acid transport system substrate-binding protein